MVEENSSNTEFYTAQKLVNLDQIHVDSNNLRLNHLPPMNEEQIEEYLYSKEDGRIEMNQIIANKGKFFQIYAVEKDSKFISKEGNRTVVCFKKIKKEIENGKLENPFPKDFFNKIPITVLHGDPRTILEFLGTIHVNGKKDWIIADRASLVYILHEEHRLSLDNIADRLGLPKRKVEILYSAFNATQRYGKKFRSEGTSHIHKYTDFHEVFSSPVLKKWVKEDDANLDYIFDLIHDNKIHDHVQVRTLAKIIDAPNPSRALALAVLDEENSDMDEAGKFLKKQPVSGKWLEITKTIKILQEFTYKEIEMAVNDSTKIQTLSELISVAQELQQTIIKLQSKRVVTQ